MTCGWCDGAVPVGARRDSRFCSKRCRQAAWRFARPARERRRAPGAVASDVGGDASRPDPLRRFAYADPPYPGNSARLYGDHPDYAGEVDHSELVSRLNACYPDGWALSTSARALRDVLLLCPPDVRVGAWTKPRPFTPGYTRRPAPAWEPVIFHGGRPLSRDGRTVLDWVHAAPPVKHPGRVVGIKPSEFSFWVFESLGARPGDVLDDLFPGSGAVARAWELYTDQSRLAARDVSRRHRRGDGSRQLSLVDHAATAPKQENGPLGSTESA